MFSMLSSLEPIVRITVATLFNSLWEAAVLALVVWGILRALPNVSATTRYAVWACALAASFILPLATALPQITVQHRAAHASTPPVPTAQQRASAQRLAVRPSGHAAAVSLPPQTQTQTKTAVQSAPAKLHLPGRLTFALPQYVALGLFLAWALAALVLLVRLAVNLNRLERLKTDALPLPVDYRELLEKWAAADKGGREVRLCVCDHIEVPVAVGLFDSMILIPHHLLETLSQNEIDQIALHELAHLRRADDWTNGVQRVIQALFFFNPAVLFIAQQLDLEREVACDDWVVRQTQSVRPYASCLTKMAEVTAWPHRPLAAPGVFVTRRGLSVRVERLLRAGRDIKTNISFGPAGSVVAALVVLFFVLQTVAPTFAFTMQEDVTVPAQHVTIPAHTVHVPITSIDNKTNQIRHSSMNVKVGSFDVDVPAQHLHIASGKSAPAVRTENHNANVADVRIPSALVSNAVNAGLAGASIGLSEAAAHMAQAQARMSEAQGHAYSIAWQKAANRLAESQSKMKYLSKSDLQNFNCVGCDYSNQNLTGKSFRNQHLNGVNFSHSNLQNADFTGSVLVGVDFSGANLRGVSFRGAKMNGCDLSNADVTGAAFDGAQVVGCDVNPRALSPAQAGQWLRTCTTGCDLSGANLSGQDLSGFNLTGTDLSGADLRGVNLTNTKLNGVDLSGAKLDGATLNGTEFTGCDLDGINLKGVDTSRARFVGDKFQGNGP